MNPTEQIRLTDQVAVITGGGGGIGRAIALAFAAAGAEWCDNAERFGAEIIAKLGA